LQNTQTLPVFFIIFMGSTDCLTTVIGSLYYGGRELNLILSGLVSSNLPAFVIFKLAITVFVGLIFVLAQKTLSRSPDKNSAQYKTVLRILNFAFFIIILSIAIDVIHNLLVLFSILI